MGVVHRDLKPSNVMVGEFGEVYVLDWGLAVTLRDDPEGLLPRAADIAEIAGTPGYMAPEMASADGSQIDERTDVYLLGAILHELLTGRAPHEHASVREALTSSFTAAPPVFEASVPEELAALCRRALRRERSERYPDVVSFRDAISAYLSHQASRALEQEALARVASFERLLEEGTSAKPEELHKLAVEARFGFRQALREWPDNPGAQKGLEGLLERLAYRELERENRDAAAALVGEMTSPPPQLLERLEALTTMLAERHARLTRLERDADPTLQARERTRLSLLLASGVAVICIGLALLRVRASLAYPTLLSALAALGLILGIGWMRIRLEPGYALSRRFAGSIAVTLLALAVYLGAGMLSGVPVENTFPTMMLVIATSCGVASITLHHGFAVSAVVYVLACLAMHAWPAQTMWAFGLGHVLGFASMGAVWMRAASTPKNASTPQH
jgi:serine/threonine-protein kinase